MENNERFHIGLVSRLYHIRVSPLRHYEKTGLVQLHIKIRIPNEYPNFI